MMPAPSFSLPASMLELVDGLMSIEDTKTLSAIRPKGLAIDSRQVQTGDVFFALSGSKTSGTQFIVEAIHAGAVACVTAQAPDDVARQIADQKQIPLLNDPLLQEHLGQIAARFYAEPSQALTIIGITGTDGKTSLSHFIAQALHRPQHQVASRCGIIGTVGYGTYGELTDASHTTPDAIRLQRLLAQFRDAGVQNVAMEVSSHGLDQGRVNGIVFDIAVLTNLGRDHLDYHKDLQHYKQAKQRLFAMPGLQSAVLNWHDEFAQELLRQHRSDYPITVFALDDIEIIENSQVADWVVGLDLQLHARGLKMHVATPDSEFQIQCNLLGKFNALNVLAAIAVLRRLAWRQVDIVDAIAALQSVEGRMQLRHDDNSAAVVIDYAHTPQALEAALTNLRLHCNGKLICVFGCGGDRDRGKRPQMGAIAAALADRVSVTNDNPRFEAPEQIIDDILHGMPDHDHVTVIYDRESAIDSALNEARQDDLVLIAGKGHEPYQLIGAKKIPFKDRLVVDRVLERLRQAQ